MFIGSKVFEKLSNVKPSNVIPSNVKPGEDIPFKVGKATKPSEKSALQLKEASIGSEYWIG